MTDTENELLISKAAIAKRWGVSRQVVHNRSKRHTDFPQVAQVIDAGGNEVPLYRVSDLERYERAHQKSPK